MCFMSSVERHDCIPGKLMSRRLCLLDRQCDVTIANKRFHQPLKGPIAVIGDGDVWPLSPAISWLALASSRTHGLTQREERLQHSDEQPPSLHLYLLVESCRKIDPPRLG